MLKAVSKTLRFLVMGKVAGEKPAIERKPKAEADDDNPANTVLQTAKRLMTPERRKLIEEAMRVHRAKSKILDDLDDEDKRKLYAAAVKAFLHESDGKV